MKQKGFSPILIIALVGLVIVGYSVYQKQTTITTTPPSAQTSPGVGDKAADSQKFTDTQGRFSFEYPDQWKMTSTSDSIVVSSKDSSIRLQLSPYPSIDFNKLYEKSDGTVDQNPVFTRTKIKNLDIGGYKATMYTNESTPANENKSFDISLYFVKDAPITMISAQTNPNLKEALLPTFDQVISTLKLNKLTSNQLNQSPPTTQNNLNSIPTNNPKPKSMTTPISGWSSYINTKSSFSLQYPPSFEIVQGQVPESKLPTLDNISFSGLSKSNDSNAGVVFSISVNPSNTDGKSIQCTTNDECLTQWMAVLNKSPNEVTSIFKTIIGKSVKGFEYQNKNSLYTQTNQYFIYPDNGRIWQVNITINNYTPQEVADTINQILSTFKY